MCDVVIFPPISIVEDASSAHYHIDLTYVSFQPLMQWTVPWEIKFIGTGGILAQAQWMSFLLPSGPSLRQWESEQEVQKAKLLIFLAEWELIYVCF